MTDEWIKKRWFIYTIEYYVAIIRNAFESVLMRWMNLESIIQNEVSQKEKNKYNILMHIYIYGIWKDGTDEPTCRAAVETQRTDLRTRWAGEEGEDGANGESSMEAYTRVYGK